MQKCNSLIEQCNLPAEQSSGSYRVVSGTDYEHKIKTMFNMEDPPSVIHPITDETITPDGMLTLWNRPVIFEITMSAEKLKRGFIEVTLNQFKEQHPNCLFVVILGRIKAPRKKDNLDGIYDALTKLTDYVLVDEDEVRQFINSPTQPTNNYKLELKQSKINAMNNKNSNETSVQKELLNYLIGTENYDVAEKYFKARISTVNSTVNVVDLRSAVKYYNHYNISESMWTEKSKIFDTAIEINSISSEHTPLWKFIGNLKTSNSIPEVALDKLKVIFNNNPVVKIKSNNKLGYDFYV